MPLLLRVLQHRVHQEITATIHCFSRAIFFGTMHNLFAHFEEMAQILPHQNL